MAGRKPGRKGYRKYRNKPTEVDGILFDSKKEASRYCDLKLLERHGAISNLELQPEYHLKVGDIVVCRYSADFRYFDEQSGRLVVEDVKGQRTDVYKLKKKLMLAVHGIEIYET